MGSRGQMRRSPVATRRRRSRRSRRRSRAATTEGGFMRLVCAIAAAVACCSFTSSAFAQGKELVGDEDFAALEPKLDSAFKAMANADGKAAVRFERQSLDTALVIDLVRERLAEAGLRLATDVVRKLAGGADRAWARDLLTEV